MTREHFYGILAMYRMKLQNYGATPTRYPVTDFSLDEQSRKTMMLRHCAWMIEQMLDIYEYDIPKAMRWLGFVQGVFYATGYMTIDQMKDDNRSKPPCNHGGTFRGEKCVQCGENVR